MYTSGELWCDGNQGHRSYGYIFRQTQHMSRRCRAKKKAPALGMPHTHPKEEGADVVGVVLTTRSKNATHCNTLQQTPPHTPQHAATHGNMPETAAAPDDLARCNTLQHTRQHTPPHAAIQCTTPAAPDDPAPAVL